jgi:hypothetical protein
MVTAIPRRASVWRLAVVELDRLADPLPLVASSPIKVS